MQTRKPKPKPDTRCRKPKGWTWIACEHGGQAFRPLRCRRCQGCLRHRQKLLTARIVSGIQQLPEGAKLLFITLTSVGRPGFDFLMKAWQKLLARLRRKFKARGFVCKKEEGKVARMQHLHILLVSPGGRIPYSYICAEWFKLTGAYITWIRDCPADGRGGVLWQYLAKYLGKGQDAKVWRKEVTYSADWPKAPGPKFYKLGFEEAVGGRGEHLGPSSMTRWGWGWPSPVRWMASGLLEAIPCPDLAGCFGLPMAVDITG